MSTCFHLAIGIDDLTAAKHFYVDGLGFKVGRQTEHAMILNIGGNQVVAHLIESKLARPKTIYPNHFGLIFDSLEQWENLKNKAEQYNLEFYRKPTLRYPGKITEHHSFFLLDPANNLLEFKYYARSEAIFGAEDFNAIGDGH